jgi:hypothetical protein
MKDDRILQCLPHTVDVLENTNPNKIRTGNEAEAAAQTK